MKRCLVGMCAVLALGTRLDAQPQIGTYNTPVVNPRPVVSPYLNLNHGVGNPAVNYYGLVRPQIENHQAIQNLQQQVQTTQGMMQQNQPGALPTEEMSPTGRAVGGYLNFSHYFPLLPKSGGGGAGTGTRR
jgi:hypothetical protein